MRSSLPVLRSRRRGCRTAQHGVRPVRQRHQQVVRLRVEGLLAVGLGRVRLGVRVRVEDRRRAPARVVDLVEDLQLLLRVQAVGDRARVGVASSGRTIARRPRPLRPRAARSPRWGTRRSVFHHLLVRTPSSSVTPVLRRVAGQARDPAPVAGANATSGPDIPGSAGGDQPCEAPSDGDRARRRPRRSSDRRSGIPRSASSAPGPTGSRAAISSPPEVWASASTSCSASCRSPQSTCGRSHAWFRPVPPGTTSRAARSSAPSRNGTAAASMRGGAARSPRACGGAPAARTR